MGWKTLVHNGVLFPPPYERLPPSITIKYKGQPLTGLTENQEEAFVLYAKHYEKTQYMQDKVFLLNFIKDLKKLFKGQELKDLKSVDDLLQHVDVVAVVKYLKRYKPKKQQYSEDYKTCTVDGETQPVSNFRIEPPDLFKGRGTHPLRGKLKARIQPGDVTLNISKGVPIPAPNVPGKWGEIVHVPENLWIASWTEVVTGKRKYVFLAQSSTQRQTKDINKYDLARQLANTLPRIRTTYMKLLSPSSSLKEKQLGVAIYMIDHLALRVGNEKGKDEADTVGVTSLKVENIQINDGCVFQFDFLGKDSIRYSNQIYFEEMVCQTLAKFIKGKKPKDPVFGLIRPSHVNEYLHKLMPGLTAKVFRTCNASLLFWEQLSESTPSGLKPSKRNEKDKSRIKEAIRFYNRATVKVAELCNHQKNVSKSQEEQINRLKQQLKTSEKTKTKEIRERIKDKQMMKNLNLGTSRNNYIDPRITVAYFKLMKLPLEKAFTKTLRDRFTWATENTPQDWKYVQTPEPVASSS